MEVQITVPFKADISAIEREYPDIYLDYESEDEDERIYFVGRCSDDPLTDDNGKEIEWLTHAEAVECCGFCEGAVEGCETMIEGNGGWAQGMISRRDFSSFAVSNKERRAYKRTSNSYWKAHKSGENAKAENHVSTT